MTDVLVVGGGIIGLTAASRLRQRGADLTIWTADDVRDTVLSVAAAVWCPSHVHEDPWVLRWAAEAYGKLMRQAAAGVPGVICAGPGWWRGTTVPCQVQAVSRRPLAGR